MFSSASKQKGFTLIELLVVIAIIAILAAILFPVFAKAREKAKQTTCTSNLKQMGMSIAAYCQDYDEFMPLANSRVYDNTAAYSTIWITAIHPYIAGCAWDGGGPKTSKILFCPADTDEILLNSGKKITNYMYPAHMGHMGYAGSNATYRPRSLGKCLSPSTCAVIIDGRCRSRIYEPLFDFNSPATASAYIATRHFGGTNVLYADNHVAWFPLSRASSSEISKVFLWNMWSGVNDWPY
ncbi:MAG: prepilin-type N-terminal cleavage/methylation domain-containing protein [Armatimonadota bacterium]